jgi:hypothetical protein
VIRSRPPVEPAIKAVAVEAATSVHAVAQPVFAAQNVVACAGAEEVAPCAADQDVGPVAADEIVPAGAAAQ